ncbi:MAG TPA: hypothetical protein VL326_25640 [Kofleriaceae bacterium]|jgi:hypothetical protein|nr:hypothetical protein [Kofleriaceae bacterium]
MITRTVLAGLLLVAAPHTGYADDESGTECPAAFRGASITASDIRDGVTLTFTTEHARITQMRDELRSVATLLEQKGTEVQTASYDEDVAFPPVDLEVFDVEGGARVSVRASRPRDIPELRTLAKSFEHYWETSQCHGDYVVIVPEVTKKRANQSRRPARSARR